MEENKVILYSNYKIEISESQDNSYLNVKFIICNFDVNRNNVMINRDTISDWIDTLIMKPLVGLIKLNRDNELDFTSHEAKKVTEIVDGKPQQVVKFGTEAFGVFDSVQIETIDGVEYITANCRVWKRFTNCCNIIQNRFDKNEPLNTSWEIAILDSSQEMIDGKMIKVINDGVFIGHALLSKYTPPAYDCSGMLEVAEEQNDFDDELAQAFISDLTEINKIEIANNTSNQTDENSADNKLNNENITEIEGGLQMSEQNKTNKIDIASLTTRDISSRVRDAIWESNEYGWAYDVMVIYPLENRVLIYKYDTLDEDFIEIIYSIDEEGNVSLGEGKDVKMTFAPKTTIDTQIAQLTIAKEKAETEVSTLKASIETKDTEISELKETITSKETELSSKISSIVDLGKDITVKETVIAEKEELLQAKETEIAELLPYKAQIEEINAEKNALEIAEKKEAFKNEYLSTKLISEKDLEIAEVKEAIELMDNSKMEIFIAQKVIANARAGKPQAEIEVSESKAEINLNSVGNGNKEFKFADCWK